MDYRISILNHNNHFCVITSKFFFTREEAIKHAIKLAKKHCIDSKSFSFQTTKFGIKADNVDYIVIVS